MRTLPRLAAIVACGVLSTACTPQTAPSASNQPAAPTSAATSVTKPSASPTPELDLTQPGAAQQMIRQLVEKAGTSQVLMVSIKRHEASIGVLVDKTPKTWAYRDGTIKQITSDLAAVDQASFDPFAFDLSDVGALFRAAAATSGSDSDQELQIVDQRRVEHSASDLKMAVSTNPETRTVFFNADGTFVPLLDFNTSTGIAVGLSDALGAHTLATQVSVSSAAGASVDYPATDGTTVHRVRSSRIPVIDVPKPSSDKGPTFDPRIVSPATIWRVLARTPSFGPTTVWTMTADATSGTPRLRFTIGSTRVVTDLAGVEVKE